MAGVWRRRLFTIASAVSLLLCMAACMLWARSLQRWDAIMRVHPPGHDAIVSFGGRLWFWWLTSPDVQIPAGYHSGRVPAQLGGDGDADDAPPWLDLGYRSLLPPTAVEWTGLFVLTRPTTPDYEDAPDYGAVAVPFGYLAAFLGVLPVAALARVVTRIVRRRKQTRRGFCPRSGYNVRASPERCPECGTAAMDAGRITR
jgi:hypothetical protein